MAGSVEELLVKISADVDGLKKGLGTAANETRKFQNTVKGVETEIKGFRTQAVGAIQGLGGLENVFDALSGKGQLSAGTISQLTQLLPLLASPAGAATTAIGALGIGLLKVYEAEKKVEEKRLDGMLKETNKQARAAAKGWEEYFKAIEEGMTDQEAELARVLGTRSELLDQQSERFQKSTADIKARNEKLREEERLLVADQQAWKESGRTHGFFGRSAKATDEALAKVRSQIASNEATISKGYTPALKELAKAKREAKVASDDLNEADEREKAILDEILFRQRQRVEMMSAASAGAVAQEETMAPIREETIEDLETTDRLYAQIGDQAASTFTDMVMGAESVEEAMERLMRQMIEAIIKMLILRAIAAGVGGGGGGAVGVGQSIAGGFAGGVTGTGATASTSSGVSSGSTASGGGSHFHYHDHSIAPRSSHEMAHQIRSSRMKAALEDMAMTGDLQVQGRSR